MSEAVPGAKSSLWDGVLGGQSSEGLLQGIAQLFGCKRNDRGQWVWLVNGMDVADHLQQAGLLGVEVGVFGLLIPLCDTQVEGQVLGYPVEVLP